MRTIRERLPDIDGFLRLEWLEADAVEATRPAGQPDFDERAGQLTVGGLRITGVVMLSLVLLAWPTDLLVFPVGSSGMRAIFFWRIWVIATCITALTALSMSRFVRSHPFYVAFIAYTVPVCATGWLMGSIGGLEFPTTYGIYTAPLLTVLLVVRLKHRIAVTASLVAAYFLSFAAANPAVIAQPRFSILIVWTIASAITAVIAGHVVYFLLRANFRQRRDLDAMAQKLKTLVGEQSTEIRNLASRISFVQEQERARIARDLHDDLGQTLVSLGMQLEWLQMQVQKGTPYAGGVEKGLETARSHIGEIHDSLDRILAALGPRALETQGFDAALKRMVQALARRNGYDAEVNVGVETDSFSFAASVVLFRIVQEAVTNISRHSRAGRAEISIVPSGGRVVLRISDDGAGFDPAAAAGKGRLGLMGIRERSLLLKGDCLVRSAPGQGCTIEISFPADRLKDEVLS
jgi:signal transduction histidine kinase